MAADKETNPKAAEKTAAEEKPEEVQKKPAGALEEDDEFEDFPVDGAWSLFPRWQGLEGPTFQGDNRANDGITTTTDWAAEETEAAGEGGHGTTTHLWEESWDDDDTSDDFSVQLK